MLLAAIPALAQEHNRFAMGIKYTVRLAADESAHGIGGIGINWRLGHSEEGWGKEVGLGWFSTDLEREIGGRTVTLGKLEVRPFVGGYGYTYSINEKLHVAGNMMAGFAITSFELDDEADAVFRARPQGAVETDVSTIIPVLRPEVSVWYDVHPKFGISVGLGYTFARPTLTITSAGGTREKARLRADTFALSAGMVYRIF